MNPSPLSPSTFSESSSLIDPDWDAFASQNRGDFQQSSAWAEAKHFDGWKTCRFTFLDPAGSAIGGAQILTKKRAFWTIGYLPKGPVLGPVDSDASEIFPDLLSRALRASRLTACIGQALSPSALTSLFPRSFVPAPSLSLIRATLIIDTSRGLERVTQGIRPQCRSRLRKAEKAGLLGRFGSRSDLPRFFDLMLATCHRQQTEPSPASLAGLTALYDSFERQNGAFLRFIEMRGEIVAGALCLVFGNRLIFFKLGWDGRFPEFAPAKFLVYNVLQHCCETGLEEFDFVGLDPVLADALESRREWTAQELGSRDVYKTDFGGQVKRFSTPAIWFRNRLFRLAFSGVTAARRVLPQKANSA